MEEVIEATGATAIPDGKFVLSVSSAASDWHQETLRSLQVGDSVDINISSPDSRWNKVTCAVGSLYWF